MDFNVISRLDSYSKDLYKLQQEARASKSLLPISEEEEQHAPVVRSPQRPLVTGAAQKRDHRALPPAAPLDEDDIDDNEEAHEEHSRSIQQQQMQLFAPVTGERLAAPAKRATRTDQQQQPGKRGKQQHYEDLFGCVTRNLGKGFLLGFAGKTALNALFPLLGLLRGRRVTVTRRALFLSSKEYGLFLGTLLATFNGSMFATRRLARGLPLLQRYRAMVAGAGAGLALLWVPRANRWPFVLFALVRALELVAKMLARRRLLPSLENGDTLLMSAASASMLHTWAFHPDALDRSYRGFLQVHLQLPPEVKTALAAIFTGARLDLAALNKRRAHMAGTPRLLTDPRGYDAWPGGELIHPTRSLPGFALKFFLRALTLSIPVYLPVFLAPLILFYPQALLRDPVATLRRALAGVARSSLFLSSYCTLGVATISLLRSAGLTYSHFGRLSELGFVLGGFSAGVATLLEKKGRRVELGLYVLSKAIEGHWNVAVASGWATPVRDGDVLVFAGSFAMVAHAFYQHPRMLRDAYRALLGRFFDTDERHAFYKMPRIVSAKLLAPLGAAPENEDDNE